MGDDAEVVNFRETSDERFGETVGEIVLGRIAGEISEGQDGEGADSGGGERSGSARAEDEPGGCRHGEDEGRNQSQAERREGDTVAIGRGCGGAGKNGFVDGQPAARDPGIQLMGEGVDGAALRVQVAVDRHRFPLFPPLDGGDVAVEVGGDFFPRVEALVR